MPTDASGSYHPNCYIFYRHTLIKNKMDILGGRGCSGSFGFLKNQDGPENGPQAKASPWLRLCT